MVSIKMWVGSVFLQILAFIDRGTITFFLGTVSTVLVIAYHILKIRNEVKGKS